ncbi:MAG: hypothetical protein K6G91_06835 [Kiritimatiellae bacterium]|nr:hypothetical protein [Kiritimatiellia bacterium]
MNLRIYVLPETVSFSGIAMEEIPSTQGSHTGYFENPYFAKIWYHTEEMWAGRWGNIDYENYWDVDRAWGGDEMPHEKQDGTVTFNLNEGAWRNGDIVWNISWGWAEKDRKVSREAIEYAANFLKSAATARAVDFGVGILSMRASPKVAAALFVDGGIGLYINQRAAAKIMEGASKARSRNCSCEQYGY